MKPTHYPTLAQWHTVLAVYRQRAQATGTYAAARQMRQRGMGLQLALTVLARPK